MILNWETLQWDWRAFPTEADSIYEQRMQDKTTYCMFLCIIDTVEFFLNTALSKNSLLSNHVFITSNKLLERDHMGENTQDIEFNCIGTNV